MMSSNASFLKTRLFLKTSPIWLSGCSLSCILEANEEDFNYGNDDDNDEDDAYDYDNGNVNISTNIIILLLWQRLALFSIPFARNMFILYIQNKGKTTTTTSTIRASSTIY